MATMKFPNIEAERARMGKTKDELCAELGVSRKTYYNWLDGATPIPHTFLIKLSKMSDSSTDYLLGLREERR